MKTKVVKEYNDILNVFMYRVYYKKPGWIRIWEYDCGKENKEEAIKRAKYIKENGIEKEMSKEVVYESE